MKKLKHLAAALAATLAGFGPMAPMAQAAAESLSTSGTLVVVAANGEVTRANDQAVVTFSVEEVDKDKASAASRANQKMKQGTEIVKREDPQAMLKSRGYYTYPVYPEEAPVAPGQPRPPRPSKPPVPVAWRVVISLQMTTTSLASLPKTVAAAQGVMALNGLHFGLAPQTVRLLDDQRIAATYANLNQRINSIAAAMGRKVGDAVLDLVDFEGSGNYGVRDAIVAGDAAPMPAPQASPAVVEPSFEPGETTLRMRLVGKVRFK